MVKEKPVAPRMYDADGFKKRAACICVRMQARMEVLLVSSSRIPERWIVPGGSVEPEEDSSMAAMREVEEEAGVKGHLDGMVGIFEDKERKTRTSVYALIVTEELPEWEDSQRIGRRRKWFAVEEAADLLAAYKPIERTYLQIYQERKIGDCPSLASNSCSSLAVSPPAPPPPPFASAARSPGADPLASSSTATTNAPAEGSIRQETVTSDRRGLQQEDAEAEDGCDGVGDGEDVQRRCPRRAKPCRQ